jgi:ComF family protein
MARWLELILGLVAPPRCLACGVIAPGPFCDACGDPPPVPRTWLDDVPLIAGGAYAGSLAAAIRRFKYGRSPQHSGPLSSWLAPRLASELGPGLCWVPVPLHPERLAERGYNQAALLAAGLARRLSGSALPRLVFRTRDTARQARLSRAERQRNVHDAFALRGRAPARVVLVDDVVTTGATALGCARALDRAGVEVAAVVALAQARTAQSAPSPAREEGMLTPVGLVRWAVGSTDTG